MNFGRSVLQLDPAKYYYISILPGDGGDGAIAGAGGAMSGAIVSLKRGTGNQRRIVTVQTDGSVPLQVGNAVVIAGVTPAAYDGSFTILSVNGATNTFTYQLATNNPPASWKFRQCDVCPRFQPGSGLHLRSCGTGSESGRRRLRTHHGRCDRSIPHRPMSQYWWNGARCLLRS